MHLREVEERGREGREHHLVAHPHLPDDPDDRGHDGLVLGIGGVAHRRGGFQLDDDEAAQRRGVVEPAGLVEHGLEGRHEGQACLQARERQRVEAGEVGQEIVVEDRDLAVTGQLHVDLHHAGARREAALHRRHRVLDRSRGVLAQIVAEAPVGDGERPHVEREQLLDRAIRAPADRFGVASGQREHGQDRQDQELGVIPRTHGSFLRTQRLSVGPTPHSAASAATRARYRGTSSSSNTTSAAPRCRQAASRSPHRIDMTARSRYVRAVS